MKLSKFLCIALAVIVIFPCLSQAQEHNKTINYLGSALIIGGIAYPIIQGEGNSSRDLFGTPLIVCAAGVTAGWLMLSIAKNKSNSTAEMISINKNVGITPIVSPRFYGFSLSVGF